MKKYCTKCCALHSTEIHRLDGKIFFFETSPFGGLYALLLREIIAHTNPQSHMCSTHLFVGRPVGNILYLVFICRLLLFEQWIRETGKGREGLDHIYP